ncbi:uncharacterized protein LOC126456946 [Schistocerca serialis cubense]|uniref:uncharacterized protein LOC126456946 n=1 Tax=Schistocerca serialis cubense TaxID=2023355 RepID=UPI00214EBEF1|nr:uncharacterized protein LOC126456946 [Schistocerca serialis cubense]XP_049948837.1 uncharacterized protein LOC126456946 [Schistocerca serialis cubense]
MAVQKRREQDIPPGAIILSEENVLEYHWKLVKHWTPTEDVWPFRHGLTILGAAASLSGIYMNSYYRKKLFLGDAGRFATYLPVAVLPGIMSTLFHQQFITNDILLQKTACPLCVQTRAAAIQSICGAIYPAILAPVTGFMLAIRYFTYDVPAINKEPMSLLNLWRKLTKPKGNIFFGIAVLQAAVGSAITYFEAKSFYTIQSKLIEEEELGEDAANPGIT